MSEELTYKQKLDIANKYLGSKIGIFWEDLPDTNSLHDCKTEEDVINACNERVQEDGMFNIDTDDE